MVKPANPFASPSPFAQPAREALPVGEGLGLAKAVVTAQDGEAYAMIKGGPEVSSDEVEVRHLASVEVMVLWETNVLHVAQLSPPRAFHVGDGAGAGCDYLVPSDVTGSERAPILLENAGRVSLVMLPGSLGTVHVPGQGTKSFAELRAGGQAVPSSAFAGAHELALPPGAKARMELPGTQIAFQVTAGNAGKPPVLAAPFDVLQAAYLGLSALAHVGLLIAVYFWTQSSNAGKLHLTEEISPVLDLPILSATVEPETQEVKQPEKNEQGASAQGADGGRAARPEGAMGDPTKAVAQNHWTLKKRDDSDPHMARERAMSEAGEFGLLGVLPGRQIGSMGPTSFDGLDTANGKDASSKAGLMFGLDEGDAYGRNGLGLSGVGEGGGCTSLTNCSGQIGFGDRGFSRGRRGPGDEGIANSKGFGMEGYTPHGPGVARPVGPALVEGTLPAAVVQRIVQANSGRFRACYQVGLSANPSLSGSVRVRFIISRTGGVAGAVNAGSTLPDAGVVSCVVGAFGTLSFPAPNNGQVTVDYGYSFTPN